MLLWFLNLNLDAASSSPEVVNVKPLLQTLYPLPMYKNQARQKNY